MHQAFLIDLYLLDILHQSLLVRWRHWTSIHVHFFFAALRLYDLIECRDCRWVFEIVGLADSILNFWRGGDFSSQAVTCLKEAAEWLFLSFTCAINVEIGNSPLLFVWSRFTSLAWQILCAWTFGINQFPRRPIIYHLFPNYLDLCVMIGRALRIFDTENLWRHILLSLTWCSYLLA